MPVSVCLLCLGANNDVARLAYLVGCSHVCDLSTSEGPCEDESHPGDDSDVQDDVDVDDVDDRRDDV